MRQFDSQTHRFAPGLGSTLVRRFHDARAASRDDGNVSLGDLRAHCDRGLVVLRIGLDTCGTEDAHGRTELGQRSEAIHEFGLNAQYTPWVAMQPIRVGIIAQEAFRSAFTWNHLAAQQHRSLRIGPSERLLRMIHRLPAIRILLIVGLHATPSILWCISNCECSECRPRPCNMATSAAGVFFLELRQILLAGSAAPPTPQPPPATPEARRIWPPRKAQRSHTPAMR